MKLRTLALLLVLFLFTAQQLSAAELDPDLQKELTTAIAANDLQLAESLCQKQLDLLPEEDSIQRASLIMQHGDLLARLARNTQGLEEKRQASQMIHRYTDTNKQLTDAELDLRAAAFRIYGQDSNTPCCSSYLKEMQRRIKRAWFPPHCCGGNYRPPKVLFKVQKNGKLSDLRIVSSSGVAIADQAAITAVINASPFYPLPEGAPAPVDISFTFDYNLFANRESPLPSPLSTPKAICPARTTFISTCD